MLVTFSSSASSDLVMFSDVARRLLAVIGKSPTALGVLTPAEFAAALRRLDQIPPDDAGQAAAPAPDDADPDAEEPITLAVRAHPLAGMIRQADAEQAPILWRAATDFPGDD